MPPSRATVRNGSPPSRQASSASRSSGASRSSDAACPSEDELAGFVDAALSPAERMWMENHLDECPQCRAALGHLAALDAPEGPRTVDRYRLDVELGRGGMGVVWRAWDPALERDVAVKLLHPELDDARFRQRALREARALARLQHPNVIAVHDVGEADGELFIATELIDGEPLDQWQRGRPPHQILAAYAQAARGLAAAHALGLVHRDVKPSNILVSRSGRACIGDFGLATSARPRAGGAIPLLPGQRAELAAPPAADAATSDAAGARPLPRLTDDGVILGTPAYMPPEQRRGEPVDASADQYALCMALAEALLGRRPPDGVTAEQLAQSDVIAPWIAIARGLSSRPGDRFPSIDLLIAALEGSAAATPPRPVAPPQWLLALTPATSVAPPPYLHASSPPPSEQPRRRSLLPAAASAAFVAAAFVAGSAILVTTRVVRPAASAAPAAPVVAAPTTAPPPRPPTTRSGAPLPTAETPLPAAWRASEAGAWRLPARGREVTILEPSRAVITPWADDERNLLMIVNLDTGVVDPPAALVPAGAAIEVVRRVGERVLAFGAVAGQSAAWELTGTPLAAWRLEVPQARPSSVPHRRPDVLVSPDGTRLVWCDALTSPTLRDAASLAILRRLPGSSSCSDVHFTGDHQLVMRPAPEDAPNGLPEGVSLESSRGEAFHTMRSPDASHFDVHGGRALLLYGALLEVVELRTLKRRGAEGNLEAIRAVAPYRGSVLAFSDQLRMWSAQGLLTVDTHDGDALHAVPQLGRFAIEENAAIWLWDPANHARRQIAVRPWSMRPVMAVRGDRVWIGVEEGVARSTAGEPAEPWLPLHKRLRPIAIDPQGRVVAIEPSRLHLIDMDAGVVQSWQRLGECERERELPVSTADGRLAVLVSGQILLVESDGSARRLELPGPIDQLALTPDGGVVAAGGSVAYLWPRGQLTAITWPTSVPAGGRVTALGLDEQGEELALGYDTGAIVYTSLDELRRRGTALAVSTVLDGRCLRRLSPAPLATLVGI